MDRRASLVGRFGLVDTAATALAVWADRSGDPERSSTAGDRTGVDRFCGDKAISQISVDYAEPPSYATSEGVAESLRRFAVDDLVDERVEGSQRRMVLVARSDAAVMMVVASRRPGGWGSESLLSCRR